MLFYFTTYVIERQVEVTRAEWDLMRDETEVEGDLMLPEIKAVMNPKRRNQVTSTHPLRPLLIW